MGRAMRAPTAAQTAVAATSPSREPPPATLPITKAPMPMKENWHRETWPEYPVTSISERPTMPSVITTPPRVSTVVPLNSVLSKARAAATATTKKTAPATSDSVPLGTRGARMVVSRPTARNRTEGSMTRAMNKKTIGSATVTSGTKLWGRWGSR